MYLYADKNVYMLLSLKTWIYVDNSSIYGKYMLWVINNNAEYVIQSRNKLYKVEKKMKPLDDKHVLIK